MLLIIWTVTLHREPQVWGIYSQAHRSTEKVLSVQTPPQISPVSTVLHPESSMSEVPHSQDSGDMADGGEATNKATLSWHLEVLTCLVLRRTRSRGALQVKDEETEVD